MRVLRLGLILLPILAARGYACFQQPSNDHGCDYDAGYQGGVVNFGGSYGGGRAGEAPPSCQCVADADACPPGRYPTALTYCSSGKEVCCWPDRPDASPELDGSLVADAVGRGGR